MRKFIIAAPLALATVATAFATPAAAASFDSPQQIRAQINQLDRQAEASRRGISGRESQRLERQVDQLRDLYARYARGGFSRGELSTLSARVDAVQAELRAQRRDGNNGRGIDRHDRYDDHRGHDRWDRR